jgi:ATP/maltotriose-dependent transcriptional regulator MalT
MPRARLRLAKLTRPDTSGRVLRERLFEILDRAMVTRFAWVSGPGGAGKTSLVASWLEQRKHRVVWYQIDAGDRDPASFFHFLGNAASVTASRRRLLPHLTPEYRAGLPDFTRRYFRQFFARLEAPAVIVFDACHEAGSDSPCLQVIARALNEVPRGVAVVCISRNEPGEPFARWLADANFVRIGANDLRLTECEACQIARTSGQDTDAIAELLGRVNGWTAGFILMLRANRERGACTGSPGDPQQAIFDYFADEVLAGADGPTRDFLLRTSILPVVLVSIAAELTGNAGAADMLGNLERHHFFTERRSRSDDDAIYEYHPLFRAFLRARAVATLKAGEVVMLRRRAAELLEQRGRIEAAAALRIEAGDWPELIRLITEQAPAMMDQGRWQTLEGWIAAVPPQLAGSHAWLLYWRGACNCMGDPDAARLHFEAAHRNFEAAGDATGRLLACAGVLQASYFQLSEQAPALPWIDELDRTSRHFEALPAAIEARVIDGLPGAWLARPQHPMVRRWAHRASERLRSLPGAQRNAALLAFVTGWYMSVGDHARTRSVLAQFRLDRQLIEDAPLSALAACLALSAVSCQEGEHDEAFEAVVLARSIAERTGVRVFDPAIALQAAEVALGAGDATRAADEFDRLQILLRPQRGIEVCRSRFLRAGILLLGGQAAAALELARRELPVAEALAAPYMTAAWRIPCAQLLALGGRHEQARRQLGRALDFARQMPNPFLQFQSQLTLAWSWLLVGEEPRGREALSKGLAIGREHD